jgi:crossover junction endodeoxyribonuclease RuvC
MLIIGLDPSLSCTGWGIVARDGNRLTHIANGQVRTDPGASLPERLVTLDRELTDVIARFAPIRARWRRFSSTRTRNRP